MCNFISLTLTQKCFIDKLPSKGIKTSVYQLKNSDLLFKKILLLFSVLMTTAKSVAIMSDTYFQSYQALLLLSVCWLFCFSNNLTQLGRKVVRLYWIHGQITIYHNCHRRQHINNTVCFRFFSLWCAEIPG